SSNVSQFGITNGKSTYLFSDANYTFIIEWSGTQWEIYIQYGNPSNLSLIGIFEEDLDCPGTHSTSIYEILDITIIDDENSINFSNIAIGSSCQLSEEENCFEIIVWDLQCKFAKCVLKYFNGLKHGIQNNAEYNKLLKQKKALDILICYDTRDIPFDTTNYNILTYS